MVTNTVISAGDRGSVVAPVDVARLRDPAWRSPLPQFFHRCPAHTGLLVPTQFMGRFRIILHSDPSFSSPSRDGGEVHFDQRVRTIYLRQIAVRNLYAGGFCR